MVVITVWGRVGDDILDAVKDNFNDDATGDDDYKKVNDHFNDDDVVNADAVKIVKSLSWSGKAVALYWWMNDDE